MVDVSSLTTMSTHLILGSLSFCTCFFTVASKARSGVKRPVLHPRRRERREQEGEQPGGQKMGVKAKRPGSRVGEDGQAWGGRERETPTKREREKTEDTVSVGPSPPTSPRVAPTRCCQVPPPPGLWGYSQRCKGPNPCSERALSSSDPLPQGCPLQSSSVLFSGAPWVLLRT